MFARTRSIARHELLRSLRSSAFRTSAVVVTLLLGSAFALEATRQHHEARERRALQGQVSDAWRKQPDRHPHRMAHYGSFAFRPPSALSFLEPGIEPYTGSSVYLEAHKRNTPNFSVAAQSSELVRFGRLSAAFVLQWLLPLLMFCSTFDSVAGEREAGTWPLALSQGASPLTLVLGKIMGALLAIAIWVAPTLMLALSLQTVMFGLAPDTLLRVALIVLGYAVYFAACAGLGVVISALHTRSNAALASLLCVWVAAWIVVPRVAAELAARMHPVPARAEMEAELARQSHAAGNGHGKKSPEAVALTQRTLARYGVDRVEDLPVNMNGLLAQLGEQQTSALYDRFYRRVYEAQRAQEASVLRWGVLSPVLLLRGLSMSLAGSDAERYQDFLEQAEAHRFGFIAHLNDVHAKHLRYGENDRLQRAAHELWGDVAPFAYRPPALREQGTAWARAGAGLVAWLAVLLAMTVVVTRREGGLR